MESAKKHIKSFSRGLIDGFSDLFDFYYPEKDIAPKEKPLSGEKAIESDWINVYKDIESGLKKFEEEESEKIKELVG